MRVLIDTNIILDWLMNREPFHDAAECVIRECLFGELEGYITSHSITDLFYILRKDFSFDNRKQLLLLICRYFQIIPEDKTAIMTVLNDEHFRDIEDGLQIICAASERLDYIITRNISDFKYSVIPAIKPADFLSLLKEGEF